MNNKEKILKTLKDFGKIPKWRVGAIIGIHPNKAEKLLIELLEEKRVICHKETISTYWELNNNKLMEKKQ